MSEERVGPPNLTQRVVWEALSERNVHGRPVWWRSRDLQEALRTRRVTLAMATVKTAMTRLRNIGQVESAGRLWRALPHELAGGDLCIDVNGSCVLCGVELSRCEACDSTGYHRAGCPVSEGA